jgi:hypothetical protein
MRNPRRTPSLVLVAAAAALCGLARPAGAVTAIATLRCAPGCSADLQFITITKNGVPIGSIDSLGCSPSSPVATTPVELSQSGANDLEVRVFFVECPDTDVETGSCDVDIPASQEPWGAEFTVDNQGAGCNAIGAPAPVVAQPVTAGGLAATLGVNSAPCVPSATTLCIDDAPGDRRFKVQVSYATSQGGGLSGAGHAVPLAGLGVAHGGLFWFFGADNPEMLIKILRACTLNDYFWIFHSEGTNVGFTLTVLDTVTGKSKTYTNPDLHGAPPVQDTSALPCE